MVTRHEIERQLKAIGTSFNWWGKGEARELEHIIEPGETIMYCVNGRYENGFAMLCVTDHRTVMIDKKPLYITIEDIRYDMISEVDFDGRLVDSTITIHAMAKKVSFTSFKGAKLRQVTAYLQRKIMETRKSQILANQMLPVGIAPEGQVNSFEHRITNPYAKVPLMLKRKVSRFYSN